MKEANKLLQVIMGSRFCASDFVKLTNPSLSQIRSEVHSTTLSAIFKSKICDAQIKDTNAFRRKAREVSYADVCPAHAAMPYMIRWKP